MSERQRILDYLEDCEPKQIKYVSRDTAINMPTLKAWLGELEREGAVVVQDGKVVRISEGQKWLRRAWR